MRNQEERLRDELRGLISEAFAVSWAHRATDNAANGRMIVQQLRRANDLFDRIKALGIPEAKSPEAPAQPKEKIDDKAPRVNGHATSKAPGAAPAARS